MSLNTLHTLSGLMIVFCFLAKIGLQAYIEYRHGRFGGIMAELHFFSKYIWPYRADVDSKYKVLKYVCNVFLRLVVVSFVMNAILGVLMLLRFGLNPVLVRS
jgi:hypothetical protein